MTSAQDTAIESAFALLAEHFGDVVIIAQPDPLRTNLEIRNTGNVIAIHSMCEAAQGWINANCVQDEGEEQAEV